MFNILYVEGMLIIAFAGLASVKVEMSALFLSSKVIKVFILGNLQNRRYEGLKCHWGYA